MAKSLPKGFQDLEIYTEKWVLETEKERRHARMAESTMEELETFYNTMFPRVDEILTHLKTFPLDDMPEPEANLMLLALSYVEVSPAIECFHNPTPLNAFPWDRFECTF